MAISIEGIRKFYDPNALYDLTGLVERYRNITRSDLQDNYANTSYEWQYFYSVLFPDKQYAGIWIGRGGGTWRFIQIPLDCINTYEQGYAYSLYGPSVLAIYQGGRKIKGRRISFRGGTNRIKRLQKITQADWVKAVFDAENTAFGEIAELKYIPATFQELNLLDPRHFTREEANFLHLFSPGIKGVKNI